MNSRSVKNIFKSMGSKLLRLPIFWIIVLAFVLLFTILSKQEFWTGYDTYFHMNGIYEDAMQIKTVHFSYFLSMFGFEQSGRIVNAVYSPILNYILGLILVCCHSWIRFEFTTFFITLVISGYAVYTCARQLRITAGIATVLAMLFMMSLPVSLLWIQDFEFTGLGGMILLPLVLLAGIKILQHHQIKVLPLAVTMAICLQVHLMTSVIAVIALLPFGLIAWVQSHHKCKMAKKGVLSAGLAFLLSGNIFGALYDVYSTNHLIPTFPNFHLQERVVNNGFFVQNHYIVGMGRLYTALLIIVMAGMLIQYRHVTWIDLCLMIDDAVSIWMSSIYFPWDRLLRICPKLSIIVQFPSRFMVMPFITTLLLLGRLSLTISKRYRCGWDVFLAVIFGLALITPIENVRYLSQAWQSNNVVRYWVHPSSAKSSGYWKPMQPNQLRKAFQSHDLYRGVDVIHKITSDYMPTTPKLNIYNYYRWPTNQTYIKAFSHQNNYHKYVRNHQLSMMWNAKSSRQVHVPLVKYGNTVVTLNHRQIHPSTSIIGSMNVNSKRGQNVMTIRYRPGYTFELLSILSVISWIVIIGASAKRRF